MADAKNKGNGRIDRLEETMSALALAQASLVQAQANLVARMAETDTHIRDINTRMAETDRQMAETNRLNSERFARIETLLLEHNRILTALPDAIRDKIGFKIPP